MKGTSARLFIIDHPSTNAPCVPVDDAPPVRPAAPEEPAPRVRKTTIDHFNEEMAVLDRPLEGDVEYYDEPKPRRWGVRAIGAAIFVLSCGGGYLAASRYHASVEATSNAVRSAPQTATAPTTPPPLAAPAAAALGAPRAVPPTTASPPPPAAVAVASAGMDDSRTSERHHHRSRHAGNHHHHHAGHARHGRA